MKKAIFHSYQKEKKEQFLFCFFERKMKNIKKAEKEPANNITRERPRNRKQKQPGREMLKQSSYRYKKKLQKFIYQHC